MDTDVITNGMLWVWRSGTEGRGQSEREGRNRISTEPWLLKSIPQGCFFVQARRGEGRAAADMAAHRLSWCLRTLQPTPTQKHHTTPDSSQRCRVTRPFELGRVPGDGWLGLQGETEWNTRQERKPRSPAVCPLHRSIVTHTARPIRGPSQRPAIFTKSSEGARRGNEKRLRFVPGLPPTSPLPHLGQDFSDSGHFRHARETPTRTRRVSPGRRRWQESAHPSRHANERRGAYG